MKVYIKEWETDKKNTSFEKLSVIRITAGTIARYTRSNVPGTGWKWTPCQIGRKLNLLQVTATTKATEWGYDFIYCKLIPN